MKYWLQGVDREDTQVHIRMLLHQRMGMATKYTTTKHPEVFYQRHVTICRGHPCVQITRFQGNLDILASQCLPEIAVNLLEGGSRTTTQLKVWLCFLWVVNWTLPAPPSLLHVCARSSWHSVKHTSWVKEASRRGMVVIFAQAKGNTGYALGMHWDTEGENQIAIPMDHHMHMFSKTVREAIPSA